MTRKGLGPSEANLLKAILLFVSNPSQEILNNNRTLLKRSSLRTLKDLEMKARSQNNINIARIYRDRRRLLECCKSVGIDEAFRALGSMPTELNSLLKRAAEQAGRYSQSEDVSELDTAAVLFHQIFSHPQFSSIPQRHRLLAIIDGGGIFLKRSQRRADSADLTQAIEILSSGLELASKELSLGYQLLSNLGGAYRARYLLTSSSDDLRCASYYYNKTLSLVPPHHEHYGDIMANLGACLNTQYDSTGLLKDLEKAILCYRHALERIRSGPSTSVQAGLGNALCKRYERTGSIDDLEEAIENLENALVQHPTKTPPQRAHLLDSLGNALHDSFVRFGNRDDLERAIKLLQDAVEQTSSTSLSRPSRLSNLALALRDRLRLSVSDEDFEQSIWCLREAKKLMPKASPHWPAMLVNLQSLLVTRYQQTGEANLLQEAVEISEEGLDALSQRSPFRQTALFSYSETLLVRYNLRNNPLDLEKARSIFHEARSSGGHDLSHSLIVARNWATWELNQKNWENAVDVGTFGIMISEKLLEAQLIRRHKERWIRAAQALAPVVAYAQARLGNLDQAIQIVENGQARLLSEALQTNQRNLEQLRRIGHSEEYTQYLQVADKVAHFDTAGPTKESADEIQGLRIMLKDSIKEIRRIPGYGDFLASMSVDCLRDAAIDAPIVYLLATGVGGLALVVRETGCTTIWLDSITVESLRHELLREENIPAMGYLQAYLVCLEKPNDSTARKNWRRSIENTTKWLYQTVMGPVLAALEDDRSAVFVPCGLLALLPLHAAWYTDPSRPEERRYAIDQCCLRFAPNGRSILAASQADHAKTHRLVAVCEPDPDSAPLPSARFEAASACSWFSPDESCTLHGKNAEKEVLLQELRKASTLHFAGHARASPMAPLDGGLILSRNNELTVGELLQTDLSNIRLAVLSACETAYPGIENPGEVIGLPTALAQAGVAGVIGSLWRVSDSSTALLMARFYLHWREGGLRPAEALRSAQTWLRDATRKEIETWLGLQAGRLGNPVPLPRLPVGERPFSHPFFWAAFTFTGI